MEPLDLTRKPPRSARQTLLGCVFLPRTIDKLRAELPGGNLGAYIVAGPRSISAYVLHKLKVDVGALRDVVARAASEDEVAGWLRERIDPAVVAEVNAKLGASRLDRLSPEDRAFVEERHPIMRTRTDLATTFDLLDADDAATFA
jgi:hypothetical protein